MFSPKSKEPQQALLSPSGAAARGSWRSSCTPFRLGVGFVVGAAFVLGIGLGVGLRQSSSGSSSGGGATGGPEQVIVSSAVAPPGAGATALSVTWVIPYGSSFNGTPPWPSPVPQQVVPTGGRPPVSPRVRWGPSPSALTCASPADVASYSYRTTSKGGSNYTSPLLLNATIGGSDGGGGGNCTLPALSFAQVVYYSVGDDANGWTPVTAVTTLPAPGAPVSAPAPLRLAVVGDLGTTANSADTLAHVSAAHAALPFASLLLVGDLSYADGSQPTWDVYGRLVSPLAATLPWHTLPGNHEWFDTSEAGYDFRAYTTRFRNPATGGATQLYYSLSVGPVHVAMLQGYCPEMRNTSSQPCLGAGSPQLAWLRADLAAVDRSVTPWVVVAFHQPFVNSNTAHSIAKEGVPMQAAVERALVEGGVDLVLSGHVHAYERSCRLWNYTCVAPDASAPVYVTIGDGGNREGLASTWVDPQPAWSLHRRASYGHGQLVVPNATHMKWEWHQNPDLWPEVADEVWIVKGAAGEVGPGVTGTPQWSAQRALRQRRRRRV